MLELVGVEAIGVEAIEVWKVIYIRIGVLNILTEQNMYAISIFSKSSNIF